MPLEKGFKLGKYEIEKLVGSGGMGKVYLANDTELNRPAAIKFLSSAFNFDDEQRNRFIQEVHSVSALNHPQILTVYEFGRTSRQRFRRTLPDRQRTTRPIKAGETIQLIRRQNSTARSIRMFCETSGEKFSAPRGRE